MTNEDMHTEAEKELLAWIDKWSGAGLYFPNMITILQFHTWDLNRRAFESWKKESSHD